MKRSMLTAAVLVLSGLQVTSTALASDPLDQWNFDVIDSGIRYTWPTLRIDSQGYPHIAYIRDDLVTQVLDITYARYTGTCWVFETVITDDEVSNCHLALNGSDEPIILFVVDPGIDMLCQATPASGDGWTVDTILSSPNSLYLHCLDMGPDDNPCAVFNEVDWGMTGDREHNYLYFDGSNWQQELVWEFGYGVFVGDPSMVVSSDGTVHLSEYRGDEFVSYLYHCQRVGGIWSSENIIECYGNDTDIDLTGSGHPCIVYIGSNEVMYAWNDGASWTHTQVDPVHDYSRDCVLSIDGMDESHIAFFSISDFDLRYAWGAGSSFESMALDTAGWVGTDPDIALDASGNPFIVYFDHENDQLKLAWYGDPTGLGEEWQGEPGGTVLLGVSPNPAGDLLYIETSQTEPGPVRVSVFDMSGRLVLESSHTDLPAGLSLLCEDISGLCSGVYHLRVGTGSSGASRMVTVIRP